MGCLSTGRDCKKWQQCKQHQARGEPTSPRILVFDLFDLFDLVWFVWSLILTYLDISWHILTVLEFVELCRLVEPPWGLLKDRCFNSTFQTRICSTKDATRTKKLHQNLPWVSHAYPKPVAAKKLACPVPTVSEKVSIVKPVPGTDHNRSHRNHLPSRSSESSPFLSALNLELQLDLFGAKDRDSSHKSTKSSVASWMSEPGCEAVGVIPCVADWTVDCGWVD